MKTIIIYYSQTGNTRQMANAIYDGHKEIDDNISLVDISDTIPSDLASYENIILGCPAMGAENLEEDLFEPFFSSNLSKLDGKNVYLFGSYGWGDGEWMRLWEEQVDKTGAIRGKSIIANETPEKDILDELYLLGKEIASK